MMSSPSTECHQATMPTIAQRRRQHNRQISTPSAFEPATRSQRNPPPATAGRPAGAGHRRGLSLDTRRQHIRHRSTASVSTPATAPVSGGGARDFELHDVLREAQQQCLQAGPGAHANAQHFSFPATGQTGGNYNHSYSGQQDYLVSPHGNTQAPSYGQSFDHGSFDMFMARANMANAMAPTPSYFSAGSALSTPTYSEFPEAIGSSQGWISEGDTAGTRRARRVSNGIQDRVSKFETLVDERPGAGTPPNEDTNDCLPARQVQASGVKQEQRPARFEDGYDESMEETIKPGRKPSPRVATVFDDMRQQAEQPQPLRHQPIAPAPTPQRSHTMPSSMGHMSMPSADDYMSMNQFSSEFMKIRTDYHDGVGNPLSANSAPPYDPLPDPRPHDSPSQPASPERRSHHHRRTDSVASIQSAASISSINIEETRTTTGVTLDDIAIHIRGPDVADGKWECVFDGCGKRFGRKENIKSHVQTHLNDRQYQCPSCAKCFVRQHDLKRHAKIHSGVKAYGCECGNSFARHDALTRHKQRGMCVGAFDGVVRKVVKRGRPRKHRPDMDERTDKSARTRKKNMSVSSVSSGFSDASSGAGSPRNEFDVVMGNGFDAMDVAFDMGTLRGMPPVIRPRAAPELQGYANSPESAVSYVSPGAIMEQGGALPSHPASPAKSTTSHYAEPPGLSQSSSPPACHLFESDASQPADGMPQFPAAPQQHQHQSLPAAMMGGLAEQDEDLMKTFTHGEGLVPVDRDPGMFGVSEFDREYAASMMNADDDLFFGTG